MDETHTQIAMTSLNCLSAECSIERRGTDMRKAQERYIVSIAFRLNVRLRAEMKYWFEVPQERDESQLPFG